MSVTEQVFVYGTLRPPRPDTPDGDCRYYPKIASYVQSASPAHLLQGELYDLGTYPAARLGEGVIQGDLLIVEATALEIMDRIEGHPTFFKRAKVLVQTEASSEASSIKAWIYWAPEGLVLGKHRIVRGDWLQRKQQSGEAECALVEDEIIPIDQSKVDAALQTLVRRFAKAECSWLNSVRPDGRAHSAPVWHVWYRGRAYVVTISAAVKVANIMEHPVVVITHPDPVDPIIIEGWATLATGMEPQLQPLFKTKYDWDIDNDSDYDAIIEITPTKLMAWGKYGEGRWPGTEVLQVWSL
jgi:gamma-glutamylcyclotransferase (GGCT)/AIG2-like uncharacterized protein YtfP